MLEFHYLQQLVTWFNDIWTDLHHDYKLILPNYISTELQTASCCGWYCLETIKIHLKLLQGPRLLTWKMESEWEVAYLSCLIWSLQSIWYKRSLLKIAILNTICVFIKGKSSSPNFGTKNRQFKHVCILAQLFQVSCDHYKIYQWQTQHLLDSNIPAFWQSTRIKNEGLLSLSQGIQPRFNPLVKNTSSTN